MKIIAPLLLVAFFVCAVYAGTVFTVFRSFDTYAEPFPETLPAGYCLMTDGSKWTTRGVQYVDKTRHTLGSDEDTKERAIYWAWRMRESWRKDKYAPRLVLVREWRPANPELCKEVP